VLVGKTLKIDAKLAVGSTTQAVEVTDVARSSIPRPAQVATM